MKRKTNWLEVAIDNDRYRIAVSASNSERLQGKIHVEKYVGDKADEWDWAEIGWNGVLNLFDKLPRKWEANI